LWLQGCRRRVTGFDSGCLADGAVEAEQELAAHPRHRRPPGVAVDHRGHWEPFGAFANRRNLLLVEDHGGRGPRGTSVVVSVSAPIAAP
jgi:hypothetical protein